MISVDISFHQLTEQYDASSLNSLLINTLSINSHSTFELEKVDEVIMEEIEEDEEDHKEKRKGTQSKAISQM